MTTEQEKDFKKRGIYNDIILMTNLTMIYCYIMFFALEEVVNIFGKRYRHSTKYYYNIVREVLDRINCDNINCFKTSQQDAGQMVLDVVKEIEDRLVLMINSYISYLLLIKRLTIIFIDLNLKLQVYLRNKLNTFIVN